MHHAGCSPLKSRDVRAVESGEKELAHAQLRAARRSGDFTDGPARAGAAEAQSAPSHARARRRRERRQVGGFLRLARPASPVRLRCRTSAAARDRACGRVGPQALRATSESGVS